MGGISLNKELFDKIIPFKIYDCLPWEKEKTIMLSRRSRSYYGKCN
jgi:hypothetical protein